MRYQYYQFVEITSSRFLRTGHEQQERVKNTVSTLILWKNNQRKKNKETPTQGGSPHCCRGHTGRVSRWKAKTGGQQTLKTSNIENKGDSMRTVVVKRPGPNNPGPPHCCRGDTGRVSTRLQQTMG